MGIFSPLISVVTYFICFETQKVVLISNVARAGEGKTSHDIFSIGPTYTY